MTPTNTGQAILVLRPDLFRPGDHVLADITGHLEAMRNSGSIDGLPVRMPGDAAAKTRADNEANGISIPEQLAAQLHALADELGVDSPFTEVETR